MTTAVKGQFYQELIFASGAPYVSVATGSLRWVRSGTTTPISLYADTLGTAPVSTGLTQTDALGNNKVFFDLDNGPMDLIVVTAVTGGPAVGAALISGWIATDPDAAVTGDVAAEAARAAAAESTNAGGIVAEQTRATGVEATKAAGTALTAEQTRATTAEGTNATAVTTEQTRATAAEATKATAAALTAEAALARADEALLQPLLREGNAWSPLVNSVTQGAEYSLPNGLRGFPAPNKTSTRAQYDATEDATWIISGHAAPNYRDIVATAAMAVTAAWGDVLRITTSTFTVTVTGPANLPRATQFSFKKVDSSSGTVVIAGTVNGDTGGAIATQQYTGSTLIPDAAGNLLVRS